MNLRSEILASVATDTFSMGPFTAAIHDALSRDTLCVLAVDERMFSCPYLFPVVLGVMSTYECAGQRLLQVCAPRSRDRNNVCCDCACCATRKRLIRLDVFWWQGHADVQKAGKQSPEDKKVIEEELGSIILTQYCVTVHILVSCTRTQKHQSTKR